MIMKTPRFNFMRHNDILRPLLNLLRKKARSESHKTFDLIEYTLAFARTRRKTRKNPINFDDPQYPEFNNVDYDPEKLMYVYNTAVVARKSLAALDDFTRINEMHNHIREINGNIYNIIAALGKENRKCEETRDENTTYIAQHGEN